MNFLTDNESSLKSLLERRSAESLLEEDRCTEESIQALVRDMERMTPERMELLDQKNNLQEGISVLRNNVDVQREIHGKLEEQLKQLTLLHALEGEELKRLEDVAVGADKAFLLTDIELRTLQIDLAKLKRKRGVESATQEDLKTLEEHAARVAALEAQMKKEAEESERSRQQWLDGKLKLKNANDQLDNTKKQVEESSKKLKSEEKELKRLKKELKKLNARVDEINQKLHLQCSRKRFLKKHRNFLVFCNEAKEIDRLEEEL
jgi:chromosome segregation ATPase